MYEDPKGVFFGDTDWIELQFNDDGCTLNNLLIVYVHMMIILKKIMI